MNSTETFVQSAAAEHTAEILRLIRERGMSVEAALAHCRERSIAGSKVWAIVEANVAAEINR